MAQPKIYTDEERYIRDRYNRQKIRAGVRGIEFHLTLQEWWDIWKSSGKWEQRGRFNGQYGMSRHGDMGPYAVGNVKIQQTNDNVSEAQKGKTNINKSHPGIPCPWKGKRRGNV